MDLNNKKSSGDRFCRFYRFSPLTRKLLDNNIGVVGLDNLNPYYDPELKKARLAQLTPNPLYSHVNLDLSDRAGMAELFAGHGFDAVVNLAAQAGVRYSLINPHSYVDTNIVGFVNLLEGCRLFRGEAFCLCLLKLCLRRQHKNALFSAS